MRSFYQHHNVLSVLMLHYYDKINRRVRFSVHEFNASIM